MYGASEIARRQAIQRSSDVPIARSPSHSTAQTSKKASWQRIVGKYSVFSVVLISCFATFNMMVPLNSPGMGNFGDSAPEMENLINSVVERKVKESIDLLRKELNENMEDTKLELLGLDGRFKVFESLIDGFRKKSLLTIEEFDVFFEEFIEARLSRKISRAAGINGDDGLVGLDEMMLYIKGVVENEIEKHAADGLGMVDYLSGGTVVEHSETEDADGRRRLSSKFLKMFSPSFGEPGQCFPFKGDRGFVVIELRKAIIPKSVTLEHVAKSVVLDRFSAPKHCRVSGWLRGKGRSDAIIGNKKLLTEFKYDLEKRNVQTYQVVDLPDSASNLVDTIRLDFMSNHGGSYTCIYRFRVHGQ